MSFSEKVLWLLLNTVLEQKTPARRPPLVKIILLEIPSDLTSKLPILLFLLSLQGSCFYKSTNNEKGSSSKLLIAWSCSYSIDDSLSEELLALQQTK